MTTWEIVNAVQMFFIILILAGIWTALVFDR